MYFQRKLVSFSLTVLLILAASCGRSDAIALGDSARQHIETDNYAQVVTEIAGQAAEHGKDKLLVVFDIDNTLLANKQDLGTDQWFEWQLDLIKSGQLTHAVASDLAGLVAAQNTIYALGKMRETEDAASDVIATLHAQSIATIAMTARNIDSRDATIRELLTNDMEFRTTAIGNDAGFASSFLPYDIAHPESVGISVGELAAWGINQAKPISYTDGIAMLGGQHKGAALRVLLQKTRSEFAAIIFIDDKLSNLEKVAQAFTQKPIKMTTIRYTREDANVERFRSDDKSLVIHQWQTLRQTLQQIFD